MSDLNRVSMSGEVAEPIRFAFTSAGVACCSFWIVCKDSDVEMHRPLKVKANVYGEEKVEYCKTELWSRRRVLIHGQLMTRKKSSGQGDWTTEIRVRDVQSEPEPQHGSSQKT